MKAKPINLTSNNREFLPNEFHGLPIAFYMSNFQDEQYDYIDWHWHDEVQYCFVLKGEIKFKVNNENYIVSEGNGIFINSCQVHTSVPVHPHMGSYYCFEFSPNLLYNDYNSFIYQSFVLPIIEHPIQSAFILHKGNTTHDTILESIQYVKTIITNKEPAYELDLVSEICKIWKNTYLNTNLSLIPSSRVIKNNERLRNIFQIIQTQYADALTLDTIAQEVHLSRSECSRFFQKSTGQGLFQYINQYRIHKSLYYLTHTQKSIAEIAQLVGFSNQSYYTSCFKKQMSMTPKQYQKIKYSSQTTLSEL